MSVNDAATKKVADYWGGLVTEGAIDSKPMYTPEWNAQLNNGTLLSLAERGLGARACCPGTRRTRPGKWKMAPLPQWTAGENKTGSWGGSSTAVTAGLEAHRRRGQVRHLAQHRARRRPRPGQGGRHLPGRDGGPVRRGAGQRAGVLRQPARLLPGGQGDRGHRGRLHLRART